MTSGTSSPYRLFQKKLGLFADERAGIRNPFVIVAVDPAVEHRVTTRLSSWATDADEQSSIPPDVTIQPVWLDELLPKTKVYKLMVALGGKTNPHRIEETMQDQLAIEIVHEIVAHEIDDEKLHSQRHIVLLLNLGSLYPFTRASELLDELDRRNVKSTIGIPFPGDIVGGKLNFFGGDSRHYYPAHQIDGPIREGHLQQ